MNIYRALRRGTILRALTGQEPYHWVRRSAGVVELGSKYGRWGIDLSQMAESSVVLSFGLGEDVTFELALLERYGCRVYGFDPTPRSIAHVARHAQHPRLVTFPYALSDQDASLVFVPPPQSAADDVSASAYARYGRSEQGIEVPCLTLDGARRHAKLPHIDVLKMDVEGAEFDVIHQALRNHWLGRVRQILVEFHHFLPGICPSRTRDAIDSLQQAGFSIAWIGRTNHEYLFTRTTGAAA